MTTEEMIAMLEKSRERMHKAIDERIDGLIESVRTGQPITQKGIQHYDLSEPAFLFKGKKPISITYPNGEKVITPTWLRVAEELLKDCNSDPQRHEALLQLRHKVGGKNRWLITASPEGMNVPIKIDRDLYFEGKFDTEYLLKMMTEKVFDRVGYPYEFIEIEVWDKGSQVAPTEDPEEAMTMKM